MGGSSFAEEVGSLGGDEVSERVASVLGIGTLLLPEQVLLYEQVDIIEEVALGADEVLRGGELS